MQDGQLNNLPESNIKPRSKISIVWLVPIIAILIGSWLAYKAWSEKGPEITITFKTAEGLEAGKTKIKYKNVEIGTITTIEALQEHNDITVTAEMIKTATPFLTNKTRFWVVTARIGASGISGLGTLLSGAYIDIDPSKEGKKTRHYTGLEIPPVITSGVPGKRFVLQSKTLGSIERGVPIYYRKFNVGTVESVKLNDDGQTAEIHVFINAPYDKWVNTNTKFWNASGVDFSMTAAGFNLDTDSIVSILIGGISFDSPSMTTDSTPAEENAIFELFDSRADSLKINHPNAMTFVINFTESIRGLSIGAPVEFRGIPLGEVTDIQLIYDVDKKDVKIPVTIELDNSKLHFKGENSQSVKELSQDNSEERLNHLVKHGMRAQLETGSILTGELFVSLDFFPDTEPYVINWHADIPELPSVQGTFSAVKTDITSILKKVDTMLTQMNEFSYKLNHDLEPEMSETLKQVSAVMTEVKEFSYKLNHDLEPELSKTLKQFDKTLVTIEPELSKVLQQVDKTLVAMEMILNNDSPLQEDLHETLREFSRAAKSIKNLTDYLEKHPESLIQGKGK